MTEVIQIEKVVSENGGPMKRSLYSITETASDPAKILNSEMKQLMEKDTDNDGKLAMHEYLNEPTNVEQLKLKLIERVITTAEDYLKVLTANSISKEEKVQQSLKKMFNLKNSEEHKEDINETLNKKHRRLMNTLSLAPEF